MKRRVLTILLFLLLVSGGAIVNVAVAWGCAAWAPQRETWDGRAIEAPASWPSYLEELDWPGPDSAIKKQGLGMGLDGLGATIIEISGGDLDASWKRTGPGSDKTWVMLEMRRFGLPLRALQWEIHGVTAGPRGQRLVRAAAWAAGLRTGIDVSVQVGAALKGGPRCLPLTPIWFGFVVNTLFYAIILWLLIPGPFVLRRHIRIKCGRCPKCGYDLRGALSGGCPECGWNREPEATT